VSHDDSYCRIILNAIPLMIFVVDDDVRVHDLNDPAARVFGDRTAVLKRRCGEVLHCLHANDVPEGCGRGPSCQTCIIRNSVTSSLRGQSVTRRRTNASLVQGGTTKQLDLLITASPLPESDPPLALLILEDISEISTLREIIPICVKCKKVRDDQQFWRSVESYLRDHIGVDVTHGLCPACLKEHYPEFAPNETDDSAPV